MKNDDVTAFLMRTYYVIVYVYAYVCDYIAHDFYVLYILHSFLLNINAILERNSTRVHMCHVSRES